MMRRDNDSRMAICVREGVEHMLNFLATEDNSELNFAVEAFKDAQALAHTRKETKLISVLSRQAISMKGIRP